MSKELRQHQAAFDKIVRQFLGDVVRAKLGPLTTRANDVLHKLDHLERLREVGADYDFPIVSDYSSRCRDPQ